MSRCVVLTNTTDVLVHALGKLYIHILTFLINLTEKRIILPEIFWIKVKPDYVL